MANPTWVDDLLRSSAGTYRLGPTLTGRGAAAAHLPLIQGAAGRYGLDPTLLAGVVDFESGGNAGAINRSSGATGLGQVMPRERGFSDRPTQAELLDPATNLDWSARILKSGLDRYGTEDKALAAYLGAIDARGNITGAVDANGTGGNRYIRTVRERQQQYRGIAGAPDGDAVRGAAPAWVQDLLGGASAPQNGAGTPAGTADASAPAWVRDLVSSGAAGAPGAPAGAGYQGPAQTDAAQEVWPVAGQRWGQVNNPFGGTQSRSAGATVPLPSSNVGADLTASYGGDVVAPVSGTVVETFDAPNETDRNLNHGWGGMTLLRGDNGYTYRLSHARPGSIGVRPGQRVQAGQYLQQIGVSGNTTGPHLDAEKFDRPGHFVDIAASRGGTAATAGPVASGGGPVPAWVRDLLGAAQLARRDDPAGLTRAVEV